MDFKGKLDTLLAFGDRSTKLGAMSTAWKSAIPISALLSILALCSDDKKGSGPRKFQRCGTYV